MKRKKTTKLLLIIFVILLLVIPIPVEKSAGETVRAYQSLTYKVIVRPVGEGDDTKVFFFPNNFKSSEELLSQNSPDDDAQSEGSSNGEHSGSSGGNSSGAPSDTWGNPSTNMGGIDEIEELPDELSGITEKELASMHKLPETEFQSRIFGCTYDGNEPMRTTLIKSVDDLDTYLNGPKSKYLGDRNNPNSPTFLGYADTLDEDFFKNRSLIVRYYRSKDGSIPTIDSLVNANGTIFVGVTLKKPKGGETDFTGCVLTVAIDKKYIKGLRSCRFMMLPVIPQMGKIPLGGK